MIDILKAILDILKAILHNDWFKLLVQIVPTGILAAVGVYFALIEHRANKPHLVVKLVKRPTHFCFYH